MNKKLLAKIRANANKARQIDFAKMRQYAVERHEDTLNILIGLSLEIEKLHDIWFPHNIIWHSVDSNSLHNPFTGVKLSYRQRDKKIAWVWIPGKIQFLFNMNTVSSIVKRVTKKAAIPGMKVPDRVFCFSLLLFSLL